MEASIFYGCRVPAFVFSPRHAGVWTVPKVGLKLVLRNGHHGCVCGKLQERKQKNIKTQNHRTDYIIIAAAAAHKSGLVAANPAN